MLRLLSITFGMAACMFFSGCVGMGCYSGGCTSGCAVPSCDNCDGYSRMVGGPPLRRLATNLSCGSGCGDIYMGEWRNYGPNYCDPCESRTSCRSFISNCGNLFGWRDGRSQTCYGGDRQMFGLLGCVATDTICGCGSCCDSGCADIGCSSGTCGGCSTGSCGIPVGSRPGGGGCSSCTAAVSPQGSTQLSSRPQVSSRSRIAAQPTGSAPALRSATRVNSAGNTYRTR